MAATLRRYALLGVLGLFMSFDGRFDHPGAVVPGAGRGADIPDERLLIALVRAAVPDAGGGRFRRFADPVVFIGDHGDGVHGGCVAGGGDGVPAPLPGGRPAVHPDRCQPDHSVHSGQSRRWFAVCELGLDPDWYSSAFGAQLTWTLPFGLLIMFAVFNRFNRAWEEAARDQGATPWQSFRHVVLPIIAPSVIGIALFGFTLSYDEFAAPCSPRAAITRCRWKSSA